MSSNDALLPCPFCGARDHKPADEYTSRPYGGLINEENPDANCISCDNCLAHGPLCDETKGQDTIAAWNRRHAPPAPAAGEDDGVALIAAERRRQIEAEGWTPEHDDEHADGQMAQAAACYATPVPLLWPWSEEWDKRRKHDRLRQLVIAGALIAAEIDRLRRAAGAAP